MQDFSHDEQAVIQASESLYASMLRSMLEPQHNGEFVAIEPTSKEYFLGTTISEAIQRARVKYPDRLPYVMRVGVQPALHLGSW